MSVASLSDPFHVISVADEIESFINVLLYNAVERLPHNHANHMKEVMKYFLDSLPDRGYRSCGDKKRNSIENGVGITVKTEVIKFGEPEQPITPLNRMLYTMFRRFQARYVVLKYEHTHSLSEKLQGGQSSDGSEEDGHPLTQRQRVDLNYDKYGYDDQPALVPSRPSDEIVARAKRLETHHATIRLFEVVNDTAATAWPENEVLYNHSLKPRPEAGREQDSAVTKASATISTLNATTQDVDSTKTVPAYKPPREAPRQQPPRILGAISQGPSLSEELMEAATRG